MLVMHTKLLVPNVGDVLPASSPVQVAFEV